MLIPNSNMNLRNTPKFIDYNSVLITARQRSLNPVLIQPCGLSLSFRIDRYSLLLGLCLEWHLEHCLIAFWIATLVSLCGIQSQVCFDCLRISCWIATRVSLCGIELQFTTLFLLVLVQTTQFPILFIHTLVQTSLFHTLILLALVYNTQFSTLFLLALVYNTQFSTLFLLELVRKTTKFPTLFLVSLVQTTYSFTQ